MKKISIFFFQAFFCLGLTSQSIANWTFENISSAVPSTPISASSHSWKVSTAKASISGGNNNGSPDECSGAESWSTNFWPISDYSQSGSFLEFEATARNGYDLIVSGFSFNSNISSVNGARRFDVYYSIDGFGSNSHYLGSGSNSISSCRNQSYSFNAQSAPGGTITFRIYPYRQNIAAQAASMRIDNVIIMGSVLLPVSLINWSGQIKGDKIWLSWATASEQNNAHFIVERKTSYNDFEEIDRVSGQGNSQKRKEYTLIDAFPASGINYYRLRQVDFDGTEVYSEVIAIDFLPSFDLEIYPTIVQNKLYIRSGAQDITKGFISINDMNGNSLIQAPFKDFESRHHIEVGDLNPGFYLMILQTRQERIVRRFLKQ